jgi:hypothetical protein
LEGSNHGIVDKLATSYCRRLREKGDVCISAKKDLYFIKVNLNRHCKDQDTEVCSVRLEPTGNICVMAVYRAPSGNFISFLSGVDNIIRLLYKAKSKFIICGDINIDYSMDSDKKRQLDAMLQSYNLSSVVHFPTRVQNQSSMTIDNIFIDIHKITSYTVCPLYNGLSNHDAQLLTITDVGPQISNHLTYTRNILKYSIEDFKIR